MLGWVLFGIGVGIPLDVIGGLVQFLNQRLLLTDIRDLVQPFGKIQFIGRDVDPVCAGSPDGPDPYSLLQQMIEISKKYRVVLTVHDAIACVVHESEAKEARAFIEQCMRTSPTWAVGLPLNCESGMGRTYGDC